MLPRAEQKQQTRLALMDAARHLMESGRGFGSLSLREVAKTAGIVPTGFYRHFSDMDQLGLALVSEVGQTFRETIRLVGTMPAVFATSRRLRLPKPRPDSIKWRAASISARRVCCFCSARGSIGAGIPVKYSGAL